MCTKAVQPGEVEPEKVKPFDIIEGSSREGSGSYMGVAAKSSMMEKYSDKVRVLPRPYSGGLEASRALEAEEVNCAAAQTFDFLNMINEGTGPFEKTPMKRSDETRILAIDGCAYYAFVAKADIADEIKSWMDIAGHKVWLGAPATLPYTLGFGVMKALGIYDKIVDQPYGYKTLSDAVRAGDVEVALIYGLTQSWAPYVTELEARNHLIIIPPTEEEMDMVLKAIPVFGKITWVYPREGLVHDPGPKEGLTLTNYAAVTTLSGMIPEDIGYEYCRVVYEHVEEMAKGGATQFWALVGMSDEEYISVLRIANEGLGLEIHPGLAKYFKEDRGVDLEAEGIVVKE